MGNMQLTPKVVTGACVWVRCEVHVFDPTLGEEERKRVAAIHGLTLHEFGLGVKDGQVQSMVTPLKRLRGMAFRV